MDWNNFLENYTLEQSATDADCILTPLTSLGLIKVQGEDARAFLQGQLTCDLMAVTPVKSQLGAWCNPKGRMLALMLIFQRGEDLFLQMPRERIDFVIKRMGMFVLRSKVSLIDVSDDLPVIALGGRCIPDLLEQSPDDEFATHTSDGLTAIRFPGEQARAQVIGNAEAVAELWKKALTEATAANDGWWSIQNIRSGIPAVYDATAEAFIPQMLNLDLLQGISFTKGCYTGQEVVARMKYLGQLKRRMYVSHFETDAIPQPGDKLFSPQSKSPQGAGRIVAAQPSPQGGWEALVVTEISIAESGDLHLGDIDGPRLSLQPPPYGLDASD